MVDIEYAVENVALRRADENDDGGGVILVEGEDIGAVLPAAVAVAERKRCCMDDLGCTKNGSGKKELFHPDSP